MQVFEPYDGRVWVTSVEDVLAVTEDDAARRTLDDLSVESIILLHVSTHDVNNDIIEHYFLRGLKQFRVQTKLVQKTEIQGTI